MKIFFFSGAAALKTDIRLGAKSAMNSKSNHESTRIFTNQGPAGDVPS
jgi:hypothetical protein